MVVLAFLLFAPLAAAWMMLAESTAYLFAGSGGLGAALAWVPAIAVYAVLFGLMLGALPPLCIEYFFCRGFLRQPRAFGLGGAGVLRPPEPTWAAPASRCAISRPARASCARNPPPPTPPTGQ